MKTYHLLVLLLLGLAACKKDDTAGAGDKKGYVKLYVENKLVFEDEVTPEDNEKNVTYFADYNYSGVSVVDFEFDNDDGEIRLTGNIANIPDAGKTYTLTDEAGFDPSQQVTTIYMESDTRDISTSGGGILKGLESLSGTLVRDSKDHLVAEGIAKVGIGEDFETVELSFKLDVKIMKFQEH